MGGFVFLMATKVVNTKNFEVLLSTYYFSKWI